MLNASIAKEQTPLELWTLALFSSLIVVASVIALVFLSVSLFKWGQLVVHFIFISMVLSSALLTGRPDQTSLL